MPSKAQDQIISEGLLSDNLISFNLRRPLETVTKFPRKIVLFETPSQKKLVVPGLKEKQERLLVEALKQTQDWNDNKRFSFEIQPELFSILWKFRGTREFVSTHIRKMKPLDNRNSSKIISLFKKFQAAIIDGLSPGRVYLLPDGEITFHRPERQGCGYARSVLIANRHENQLLIIPFSTRIERLNRETDILFDQGHRGPALDPDGKPTVENFPYRLFKKKVCLCVWAAQPFTTSDFVEAALVSKGLVRREVVGCVNEKLKKM